MKTKTIWLIVAVILIIGAIAFLEKQAVNNSANGGNDVIPLPNLSGTAGPSGNGSSANSSIATLTAADIVRIQQKATMYPRARELVQPDGFLNSDNFTLSQYIGKKVMLIDFWTYSCINCQRTIPYLDAWYSKYKDQGLLIVGVHSPEFEFEMDKANVQKAIEKFGIQYPVVQDNEHQTWQAYNNNYWPRKYLIDIDGFIVYDHIGEGGYDETESRIQEALKERSIVLHLNETISNVTMPEVTPDYSGITDEIYLGYYYSRGQLGNAEGLKPGDNINYTLPSGSPASLVDGNFYLQGLWRNNYDNMELKGDSGSIWLNFTGKEANIVAGSAMPVKLEVYLDGAFTKEVAVQDDTLYNLVEEDTKGTHTLEVRASKGLMAYTFTFG